MSDSNTSVGGLAATGADTPSPFQQPRPLALRLWHWLDALAILGLLATVLLRKTFLSWRTNSQLIEARITELGTTISTEDAVALAKAIRAPMWEWHYVFGFALASLLVLRVVLAFVDSRQAPLRAAWHALTSLARVPAAHRASRVHWAAVKVGYVVFYALVAFMATTGLAMYFEQALGLSKTLLDTLKETHELAMWFFVAFTAAHLVGVVVAELRGARGLVSDMIHGGGPSDAIER